MEPDLPLLPYGKPLLTEADVEAVTRVLRSGMLTGGEEGPLFEAAFREAAPAPYRVAVSSGAAALHLAVKALGLKRGERVIAPTLTFAASVNCVLYEGGMVDLVDIDPLTWNMDANAVRALLASRPGAYRGIIVVDFAGYPADMPAFRELADAHGCWLLEDACHAPGGWGLDPKGERFHCGDGRFADAAIFSLHPVKHITAGEGGVLTTARPEVAERARLLRNQSMEKRPEKLSNHDGGWYYEIHEPGYNYRLSDIHAALARSQTLRFAELLTERRRQATAYLEALRCAAISLPPAAPGHAWHLFVIRTRKKKALYDWLAQRGILAQTHYLPLHLQPYFQKLGYRIGQFPHAEAYYQGCNSIPLYPGLSGNDQQRVIDALLQAAAELDL